MDSQTLSSYMVQDRWIRERFRGIYPIDLIPKDPPNRSVIIVNQDTSNQKGSHWVVIHYTSDIITIAGYDIYVQ